MMIPRSRRIILFCSVLAFVLLACRTEVFALNPSVDVSQYSHTSWKIRDGFVKGELISIAQTPDGYLWLGTDFGLVRFDGVRTVNWQPTAGQSLPSEAIFCLLVGSDGTFWIGTSKGLASWKDGRLTNYPQLDGKYIFKIIEDHERTIWVGAVGIPSGKLCSIQSSNIQCFGDDSSLGRGAFNLFEDTKGNLWVGVERGLWHWKPGPPKHSPLTEGHGFPSLLAETEDGTLLVGTHLGIHRLVNEQLEPYSVQGVTERFRSQNLLRDRDGSVWFGTSDRGIVHVHDGRTDLFGTSEGLSGSNVNKIFEDHEGNIWIVTNNGLDRFRETAVPLLDVRQGVSNDLVSAILAANDGTLWISTFRGLNKFKDGKVTLFGASYGNRDGKVNGQNSQSLFQDSRGRIWITTAQEFGYVENDRLRSIGQLEGNSLAIDEDNAKNIWIVNEQVGILRVAPDNKIQRFNWADVGHKDHVSTLIADPVRGGVWLGFFLGGVEYFSDGKIQNSYRVSDGLTQGRVSHLRFDREGNLWVATEGGLSLVKNNRILTLNSKNGLPCDTVHWSIEDDNGSLWVYTSCGLIQISKGEFDAWANASEQSKEEKRTIKFKILDSADGVRILSGTSHYSPQVAKTKDGKLWFLPMDGVSIVDPRRLAFNSVPPPIHVEQITADHQTYAATLGSNVTVNLPSLIHDLQIDYTALSLVAPEKNLFRYKLEGHDKDWQDVGNRRQAFYNNLAPGNYRFRVVACNNSGVWNETGAFLDFSIAPAYYQTAWFRSALALLFALLLGTIYQLRVRQVAGQVRGRMEERLNERERIARELHDTLLQSVQGLILKFHGVMKKIPAELPARQMMEKTLDHADEVLAEGRDRVRSLRGLTIPMGGLPVAFQNVAEESFPGSQATFKTVVEGSVLELHPLVREEVYCIGREAIINALTHSECFHVEVEITYDPKQFRLRVRDDGRGMDPKILTEGGRENHYGLQGMRERAHKIGAELKLWSRPKTGTEIELLIPGVTAYQAAVPKGKSTRLQRETRLESEEL